MRTVRLLVFALLAASCGSSAPVSATDGASAAPAAAPSSSAAAVPTPSPPPPWRPSSPPPLGLNASEQLRTAVRTAEWGEIADFNGRAIPAAILRAERTTDGLPLVVYLHSDAGLLDRDMYFAAWLASEGLFTVVPCWQPPLTPNPRALAWSQAAPRRSSARDVVRDITAVADIARALAAKPTAPVIVVGHSAGASAAVLAGSMGGRVDAVLAMAAAYQAGRDRPDGYGIAQRWGTAPIDEVAGLAVPLFIFHGTADTNTGFDPVKQYEAAARAKGKNIETLYVPNEGHDFMFVPDLFTLEMRQKLITFIRRA